MYYHPFILSLGAETTSVSFHSFLTGQPACVVLGFIALSLYLCASFPSLQLSKLKRLLALQRESCQPSCPLIKQIVSTHTQRDMCACSHRCLSLYPCLSIHPAPLFKKVKYVLRQPYLCRGIHELQPSRRELSLPIRQLTGLPKGQRNFISYT